MSASGSSRSAQEAALARVAEPFRGRLLSMYAREPQVGLDGASYALDAQTRVVPAQGAWLYDLCLATKPGRTLEIGLACGYSTVFFLAAIAANGFGHHTALDPYQGTWHGIGAAHAQSFGMQDRFTWIEERSAAGLVHLEDRGERFGITFIDGGHRYDDVLVDFTLSALVCPLGGYVILDDLWMPAVRSAVSFVLRNRADFEHVETPIPNIAAFRRVGEDARDWNHFEKNNPVDGLRMRMRTGLRSWRD